MASLALLVRQLCFFKNTCTSDFTEASSSSSVFSYESLVIFEIFVTTACFFGTGGTDLCGSAGLLFLNGPTGHNIGGRGGDAVGACCGGGYLAAGGVGVRHGGDTTDGGDAALSCMKSSSSSCPMTLWSCGEWINGLRLGEVLM